ncbi:BPTD_3080 family restriction endonuclease [Conexibacter sp. SYSU D00693]|uniref:BPTD_3080 family restriction endonuclease n=1 Tax=Conexibacter sp. SYSU D00693 TaxID=2812560 RepID=UPI00196B35A9|nr:DEAD/DEAH box helicase family protein [Conexibacter sp. SYSU D00693]
MTTHDLSNPILNSPYEPPAAHFELGEQGPTGEILPGRRPSESFIPVPVSRKGKAAASDTIAMDFDVTGERREQNTLINDIRREVERWRANNWNGVTPYTRKLLTYWSDREEPVLFCQREAVETAIFLAEIAGRHGTADYRRRLEPENDLHNDGLPRVALKMATGTGKTVVMAMLIAWLTVNKVHAPRDARFAKRFLVIAPGITIRDRLGVLKPERDDSYYRERDLVPPDLWEAVLQAQVEIINYHAFLPKDAKEIKGVSATTRKLLRGGKPEVADAFRETPQHVAARILGRLGSGKGEVVVLNDEAHHCYQDKLLERPDEDAEKEDEERNREARVWFRGIADLHRAAGVKTVYDLSATPYYLKGSGYNEGFIFPWTVSDFSLMDAIESGIVKVPRIPVDDDAPEKGLAYRDLWDKIDPPLPKKLKKDVDFGATGWVPPVVLEGAMRSLYRSYEQNHETYERELAHLGEPPPVLIVVCPNTVVSKLVFDWIAGREFEKSDGTKQFVPGNLPLLSNVVDGSWTTRQRTLLVDSAQIESGEPLTREFKKDAAQEIAAFKRAYLDRNPGADPDKLTDGDLLREAMNTIGKKGKLGEHIRCVVSVSMLTEGWDANTVTHVLGVRPFRSQLLCEQVVGRGLRRRSYAVAPDTGHYAPEYAEVYGVPFSFIPGDKTPPKGKDPRPAIEVRALLDRADLSIRFPKLDGYRIELPDDELEPAFGDDSLLHLDQESVALWVKNQGIVGAAATVDLDEMRDARPQRVAYAIAKALITREEFFAAMDGVEKPWLYPRLVAISKQWLDECVTTAKDTTIGYLLLTQACAQAAEKVFGSIVHRPGSRAPLVMPIIRRFDPKGSTDEVRYLTRKVVMDPPPTKSPLNHVVLDGLKGNSWEEGLAQILERDSRVLSYVKNERLGFTIPYVHQGSTHEYVPDFLVRLETEHDDVDRTLIIEVSGTMKSASAAGAKATTARDQWCAAVNNWGQAGVWGYVEIGNPALADQAEAVENAIRKLYVNDRDLLGVAR